MDYAGILRALTTSALVFGGLALAWAGMRRFRAAATAYAAAVTGWWGALLWTADATKAGAFEHGGTALPPPPAPVIVAVLFGIVIATASRAGTRKALAATFVWAVITTGMAVVFAAQGVFGGLGGAGVVLAHLAGAAVTFVAARSAGSAPEGPPRPGPGGGPPAPLRPPGTDR